MIIVYQITSVNEFPQEKRTKEENAIIGGNFMIFRLGGKWVKSEEDRETKRFKQILAKIQSSDNGQ